MRRSISIPKAAQGGRSNLQNLMQSSRHRHSVKKPRPHDFVLKQTVGIGNCVHGETFDVRHVCGRFSIKVLVQKTEMRFAVNNSAIVMSTSTSFYSLLRVRCTGCALFATCDWQAHEGRSEPR